MEKRLQVQWWDGALIGYLVHRGPIYFVYDEAWIKTGHNLSPLQLPFNTVAFQKHDIPILVAKKLLKPLGKPTHSSIKWFAARDVEQLAEDTAWLGKATQGVSEYWRGRNERGGSIRAPLQEWEVQG